MPAKFLQSVDNALQILELFSGNVAELGVTDVSKLLGLGRSTAHRLLSTLENRAFVEQNPVTGKYKLGMKIVNIGANKLSRLNIIKECHPCLEALSSETGEATHLALYSRGEITFVDQVRRNPAVMSSIIGSRMPAYITGTGKILLAFLADAEVEKYLQNVHLQPYTATTIADRDQLKEHLKEIREQGYGEDQQESEEGLVCFAAPVRDRTGKVVAAISISGAASRMNARKEELVNKVKTAAEQASRNCGWSPSYEWK
ncbi:IclR family transcriptional regulator [Sporomusa acidovorans]|uniref:HTH-type transcriptional regulator XynR n=1 Tax=Sporomusa acidovorans (strain ATCC 49682 / DSM 3132 / Mol) TaxID=1123286 RepID=A0ABZ3J8I1_SPOA4|nr:IclR family transcriptional regulator [Sporomusa acidovorans]OZC16652.1 transcriptional regulator KdgR [Sporomusa acidovorans DSM 3132]SDE07242.1 transcriptional regulator, IclR family [Sporomusa acidovorans]